MDLGFSKEQEFFRSQVKDTVDRLVRPRVQEIDEKDEFPADLWGQIAQLGYFGLRHEERHGGMEADTVTTMIFFEELARGSAGFFMSVTVQMLMGTYFIGRFGSERIKEEVLVPAIEGKKITCICFTEDQSGSDLAGTRTTARRDGDDWILNGTKQWITNGPIASAATVMATTDPSAGLRGLSFFLVEEGMEGFSKGQVFHKLGTRGAPTGELLMRDVRLPSDHHLGEETGRGLEYSTDILNQVRVMTGLAACSIASEAMKDAASFARKRVAFGKPIATYQLIREKFGRFYAQYEAARTMCYRVAWMIDEGLECRAQAMAAKWFATEMCLTAVDEANRIYGGNGFSMEYDSQRYLRDARFLLSGGGTHEVLLNYLGGQVLRG